MRDDNGRKAKEEEEDKRMLADLKSEDDSLSEEEQAKMINDQFKALFEYDPAMRKLIPEEEASRMSLEEKYHIITTYMRGGGIGGLIGDEYDDDEDLGMGDLSQEERAMVEEEFIKLYSEDPRFKAAL